MGKNCVLCGKPSGIYPLCKEHLQMKADGKVVKCPDCGEWCFADKKCKCQAIHYDSLPTDGFDKCVICGEETNGYAFCRKCYRAHTIEEMLDILNGTHSKNDTSKAIEEAIEIEVVDEIPEADENNSVIVVDSNNKSKCITCGRQTDGTLFCTSCYHKYKGKQLLFKITNCTNVELLDEDYEGRYVCKDGHVVKSKSERDIDNYLYEHGITHAYEKELPYGANKSDVLHPDFYLPHYLGKDKHVYIEHWGYNENNISYTKTKKFKLPIYEKLKITLICTYEKTDTKDIEATLDRKLNKNFIVENQINGDE